MNQYVFISYTVATLSFPIARLEEVPYGRPGVPLLDRSWHSGLSTAGEKSGSYPGDCRSSIYGLHAGPYFRIRTARQRTVTKGTL